MTTHTQREIEKFDALADEFWHPEGQFKTLHQINPIRLAFVEECIALSGKKLADIGCGGGILSEALAAKGALVSAIDLSPKAIAAAKKQQQKSVSSVDYRTQSVTDLAIEAGGKFDAVTCMEMLEHVENPAGIIQSCADLLKPGGIAIFSTINGTLKAHLLAVIVAEYVLNMIPKGTHDPQLFIKPAAMRHMAEQAGLRALDIIGFSYRPFTDDFIRTNNTDINYIFAFTKT